MTAWKRHGSTCLPHICYPWCCWGKNHPKKLLFSCSCSEINTALPPVQGGVDVGSWWLGIRWIQGWLGLVCAEFIGKGVCRSQGMAVPVSLCRGKWLLSSIVLIPLQAADKGSRKRYEPADKERPSSPPAKRANLSPDRGEASSAAAEIHCSHPKTSQWDCHL